MIAASCPPLAELRTQRLTLADLAREGEAWDTLAAGAGDAHPFYTRHVMEAHRASGLAADGSRVLVVRAGAQLLAVLPYRMRYDLCGFGRPVALPFVSPFVTATAPLVIGDERRGAVLAILTEGLREASGGRPWRWPLLSTETSLGCALREAFATAGWSLGEVARFHRPILRRRASQDAFLDGHPNPGRLKDLRRRRRRLAEAGIVALTSATAGRSLAVALDSFLRLEQAGWKGAGGTAMACRPSHAAFARSVFADSDGPVRVRADLLMREGTTLAVSLALVVNGTAYLLKTAYDETESRNAPGLVLEAEIVRHLHETGFAACLDSATLAGSALESLYREREAVAELIAMPRGAASLVGLDRRLRFARFETAARVEAKRLLARHRPGKTFGSRANPPS